MRLFTVLLQRYNDSYVVTAFDGAKQIAQGTSYELPGAFENMAAALPPEYIPTDN